MNLPESKYFPYDREELLNAITRFDNGMKVEDVVGTGDMIDQENECESLRVHSNTVFVQVLLEFICHVYVKDENQRERLLEEVCRRLCKCKIMNEFLIMDKSNELRVAMKHMIINFFKQVCDDFIPNAELDTTAVDIFENKDLSTDLRLYYCKNFVELDKIGQGGFGAVYKVKYKLNKFIYAVKKIPFNYKSDANFLKVMREANNIATLNHPNIVRYYSAWIEMANSDVINKPFAVKNNLVAINYENVNEDVSEECGIVIKDKSFSPVRSNSMRLSDSEQSLNESLLNAEHTVFSKSVKTHQEINWTFGNDSKKSGNQSSDTSNLSDQSDNDDFSFLNFDIQGILYIQMEYCDCDLRFWLDKRAESKGEKLPFEMDVTEIFKNILNGVDYIHSKSIIHRDLKPQNIFYSETSNTLKIGDFGLATLSGCSGYSSHCVSPGHSSAIGTQPYAAPEQLKSKIYDTKVDIYSLGIILIELLNTCSTAAEFSYILNAVKKGQITEEMKKYPSLVELVSNLISSNPEDRMSAKEILRLLDTDSKVALKEKEVIMTETIYKQNLEIVKLREHEETIKSMKQTINNMEATIQQQNSELKEHKELIKNMKETIRSINTTIISQNLEISRLNGIISELHTH